MWSRGLLIGLGCGLVAGVMVGFAASPHKATAEGAPATPGLYQIQIATGSPQPGTSPIWRVNTATGALDFCTFTNVTVSGGSHVSCQGNTNPK
jgi:hypothetical protein